MAFRATPGRTPPGPGPRSGIPSASFPSPQPPMAGPGDPSVRAVELGIPGHCLL
uniref:MutS homolog 5 n=1 Tax=Mus musculus TaxID=10090 RepID=G3UYF3_MOUSE